jgi:hypothetical protein
LLTFQPKDQLLNKLLIIHGLTAQFARNHKSESNLIKDLKNLMKYLKPEDNSKKQKKIEICKVQEIWVETEAMLKFN